jgi:hypothetical protein
MDTRLLKPPLLRKLNALSYRPDARIDRISLVLQPRRLLEQRPKRDRETLDELIILELRLRALVLGERHIHPNMNHVEIGVAEPRV